MDKKGLDFCTIHTEIHTKTNPSIEKTAYLCGFLN